MTDLTESMAAAKGLLIAWGGTGGAKRYVVWKRIQSEPRSRLLLFDATWEQVAKFVKTWGPVEDFVHGWE